MNNKRKATWDRLKQQMTNKRTAPDATRKTKGSSAPHEIIVQRLASEPDNKQTFRPVQPREFVDFPYEELTLVNLKKACATHFALPATICDVLVSNKGPSATNIKQIPHRKDRVYLVRFVVGQEDNTASSSYPAQDYSVYGTNSSRSITQSQKRRCGGNRSLTIGSMEEKGTYKPCTIDTVFPASVSIDTLLKAGKLVKPKDKNKVTLTFEEFDVVTQKWRDAAEVVCNVEKEKFSSGGFRDAFHATVANNSVTEHLGNEWVVKLYNAKAVASITGTMETTVENHCRKQVQMHAVARHLTKKFKSMAPSEFGECFQYNRCYYTTINGQPATIEEFVPGSFVKVINNNGIIIPLPDDADDDFKELFQKAECLVHHSYQSSNTKFMLLDIQGMAYKLFDPEIATAEVMDEESNEVYFCCGNCSSIGINAFLAAHKCNKFCGMMRITENKEFIEVD